MTRSTGRVLGLIPSKAGSARLPGKNIRPLAGKSLLERAIVSLRKSGICDRIFVSTEDVTVAEIARACGVDMPFMRPAHLAKDPAGVVDEEIDAGGIGQAVGERCLAAD
jgi:CMP-N-acetylneuraminic acid synthetase